MEVGWINEIWKYISDAIISTEVTTQGSIIKLLASLIFGGAVGFERKRKGQIAGVRTFALISMGSTLAMILSIYIPQEYLGLKNGDPGRIAAQIITGIGFLGAGAIIQMKGSVRGLTTAAGIWMVSTIGMAIGAGLFILSFIATLLVLFILATLEKYEHMVRIGWKTKIIQIEIKGYLKDTDHFNAIFKEKGIQIQNTFMKIDYVNDKTEINFVVLSNEKTNFLPLFEKIHNLEDTCSISLTNDVNI